MRCTGQILQFLQQQIGDPFFVRSLHHDIDGGGGEDAVVFRFQAGRRDVDKFPWIAPQLNASGRVTEKFAPCLPHTVQPLGVEFRFQAAGLSFSFNADGLSIKNAIHQIRVKNRAEHDIGIGIGQIFAIEGVAVLDAADVSGKNPVGSGVGKIHAEVRPIQFRQATGQCRHIRAGRISAFQHKGQHSGVRGRFPPGGKTQMDRDAAAIEFCSVQCGDKHPGRELFPFQIVIPFNR